jgi:V-type H+-transporting ATPase subunit a
MGELLRSEEMQLVQLFVQIEAARDTVDELGNLGLIQFKDLNPDVSPFQRNFVNEVKRCDEMERKLKFFEEQIVRELKEIQEERGDAQEITLTTLEEVESSERKKPQMDELESQFDEIEKELLQMNNHQEQLTRNLNELVELKHMLMKDSVFFSEGGEGNFDDRDEAARGLLSENTANAVKLGFITGVILREKQPSFERVLWRATRGNLFMKTDPVHELIRDPHTGEQVEKNVFIIFYQGERSQVKIKKICESFAANVYPCPNSPKERKELLSQVATRLDDLESVISRTKKHRRQTLLDVGRRLNSWKTRVIKEKAIYDNMNKFNYDIGRKCLIAEGWCPKTSTEKIVNAMRTATETSGALVPSILSVIQSHEEPPTYFKTNKFTGSFQGIVDAYGIAHYREVNPGCFTIITFPFLFAVMFGDLGHGFLLALFAIILIWKEKSLSEGKLNELVKTCFDGRYMLLMMGLFSMYTGLIYNECFSVALKIFGDSAFHFEHNIPGATNSSHIEGHVYPFGVDPAWAGAENMLAYYNSLKMKMSVIFGVTHMVAGISMQLVNALHFGHTVDIFLEFMPQMIFMLSLFGWLVFLIFYKWLVTWTTEVPPFLLTVMINMFLSVGSVSPESKVFDGQLYVQWVLIALAFISVPWMLASKPYYLKKKHEARLRAHPSSAADDDDHHDDHGHGDGPFDFGEIFIKQAIHTIEFVLGAISNTASYLRLWALSLAHSQLSAVFWERVFLLGASEAKSVGMAMIAQFITWAIWAGATVGVLMVMESLSAFLHALRLHWVEFQNKFYRGDGYSFAPFSYQRLLSGEPDD